MARLNHEKVARAAKVRAAQRDYVQLTAPRAKMTGITCDCGMDLAHFGSRVRFKAHRAECQQRAA